MFFFDTETIGFHGPAVLIQWAIDDGLVHLHEVWRSPIQETMDLIEAAVEHKDGIIVFNAAFDWFHVCQLYTTLLLLKEKYGGDIWPIHFVEEYAILEPKARAGPCLKPQSCLDLMLHARKGPYQSTMQRGDIKVKRVPTAIAQLLADELSRRIPLSDIHFAKFKDHKRRWVLYDVKNDLGEVIPDFKNVVLKFNPSSGLKALAVDMGIAKDADEVIHFNEIDITKTAPVKEMGYAPFAMAIGSPGGYGSWNGAWPQVIEMHVEHWAYNDRAREYATNDVLYTREIWRRFGCPETGDDDSELACMVGAVRWSGFALDLPSLKKMHADCVKFLASVPYNFNSVQVCRKYLEQVLDDVEKLVIQDSTKKHILEEMSKWTLGDVCEDCGGLGVIEDTTTQDGEQKCEHCDEGLVPNPDKPHPVAKRARLILDFRRTNNEKALYEKLIIAERFHVDVSVIGTLTGRNAGAGGLNATGINKQKAVRGCFPLADGKFVLCGGDFAGFEVTLMDAEYGDPQLRIDLTSRRPCIHCSDKCHTACGGNGCDDCDGGTCKACDENCTQETKIHALFGVNFFEGMTYEDILATKGLPEEHDKYSRAKNGLFAVAYFGEAYTLQNRVGVSEKMGINGFQKFLERYPVLAKKRNVIIRRFSPVSQPDGLGTKPDWVQDPDEYVESMFGFKRFFTMENLVLKELWKICQDPPRHWYRIKEKVVRREKEQTVVGATRSALLGCMFQLQGANTRAAGNHKIQSAGAFLAKRLQRLIWDLQPCGIHAFLLKTLNIHDEIMVPCVKPLVKKLGDLVTSFKMKWREHVPLLDIDWGSFLKSWAEK